MSSKKPDRPEWVLRPCCVAVSKVWEWRTAEIPRKTMVTMSVKHMNAQIRLVSSNHEVSECSKLPVSKGLWDHEEVEPMLSIVMKRGNSQNNTMQRSCDVSTGLTTDGQNQLLYHCCNCACTCGVTSCYWWKDWRPLLVKPPTSSGSLRKESRPALALPLLTVRRWESLGTRLGQTTDGHNQLLSSKFTYCPFRG